ncbi:MAG: histidine phosphatase family protein [Thermomicrobiales bacterium]
METVTTVCFVRHGETDWNVAGRCQGQENIPLNERGRAQAHKSGIYLRGEHWDVLVSSPLSRAWETARIIGEQIGVREIVPEPAFVERNYGEASGLVWAEVKHLYPDGVIPGAEGYAAVRERCMPALDALARAHPGKRLLVVAHGGAINAMLAAISNGQIGSGKTLLGNGCLCLLTHDGARWDVHSHNEIGHL